MWPFSTIRKLRDLVDSLSDMLDAAHDRLRDAGLQNTAQAETIRRLTEELEQAKKNDFRGPDGKFTKRPEVVR